MLGPYEVDYQGHKYFGNVFLRESHIFEYEGNLYIVDVENMAAYPISRKLASSIGRFVSVPGGLVPEAVMLELRRLKLVAGEEEPAGPEPEDEPGKSGREGEYPVVTIGLFLAQECNMRCIYCYGDGGEYAGKGLMSEETAFRAVDWLIANSGSAGKVAICFFGGEPLLNFPLMRKVVSYARERTAQKGKQVDFSITTNGSLLTDEIVFFLKDEKIDPLISFDGPPEYQNHQRPFKDGGGSYDRVFANIRKLREVFPVLTARATVCGDADPFRIREGMERAGLTTCLLVRASPVILNARPAGACPDEPFEERTTERMIALNRMDTNGLLASIKGRKIDKERPHRLLSAMSDVASGRKRYYGCGIGKGLVGITVTGDIYPCHRFAGQEEMRMGNIADYNAEGPNDYYRAVVDHLPECRSCWARYYCGGGCLYHNKAHTGDMHRPEPLDCRERKALFEALIHVCCRLDAGDKEFLKDILKDVTPDERHP